MVIVPRLCIVGSTALRAAAAAADPMDVRGTVGEFGDTGDEGDVGDTGGAILMGATVRALDTGAEDAAGTVFLLLLTLEMEPTTERKSPPCRGLGVGFAVCGACRFSDALLCTLPRLPKNIMSDLRRWVFCPGSVAIRCLLWIWASDAACSTLVGEAVSFSDSSFTTANFPSTSGIPLPLSSTGLSNMTGILLCSPDFRCKVR